MIALGSDIDGIPQASQKPGVAYHDPIIEGAPGHGEGHNTGMPLNIVAAIAVKRIMEREKLPGTLMLWPGVAEELRRHQGLVRPRRPVQGRRRRRSSRTSATTSDVSWGEGGGNGLVSVEYTFEGETAHSAGAPWRGRSALDAVELMNVGWNYRREHLRLSQRSHYVITNGGDQPNVVPRNASIWFYFRETDQPHIKELWDIGDKMAEGAALMTNTTWTSRILGTAYPQHMNKTGGRDDVREHPDGRACRRGARPTRRWPRRCRRSWATRRSRAWRRSSASSASRSSPRTTPAAAPTTSATSRGTCRR